MKKKKVIIVAIAMATIVAVDIVSSVIAATYLDATKESTESTTELSSEEIQSSEDDISEATTEAEVTEAALATAGSNIQPLQGVLFSNKSGEMCTYASPTYIDENNFSLYISSSALEDSVLEEEVYFTWDGNSWVSKDGRFSVECKHSDNSFTLSDNDPQNGYDLTGEFTPDESDYSESEEDEIPYLSGSSLDNFLRDPSNEGKQFRTDLTIAAPYSENEYIGSGEGNVYIQFYGIEINLFAGDHVSITGTYEGMKDDGTNAMVSVSKVDLQ